MDCFWILYIFIIASIDCVRIEKNGYKGITVSFSEDLQQESFDFAKLKDTLKNASELLYQATRYRSYFEEFIFVLPKTWSDKDICDGNVTETPKSIDVYVTDSSDVSALTTRHSKGCGHRGDIIYMPQNWLTSNTEEDLALQFVQQWSIYRYGVFSENPETYGSCTANDDLTWSPTGCYNVAFETGVHFDDGLPRCYFPDDFHKNKDVLSSIMFSSNSSKTINFCDTESFPHNPIAATLHNRICDGKAVWPIIEKTEDFLYGRNLPLENENPPKNPVFRCMKETKTYMSLVVQYTDIKARNELRYALLNFLSIIEPEDFIVSLVTFSNSTLTEAADPVQLNLQDKTKLKSDLQTHMQLRDEVENICLICGLQKAYEISSTSEYQQRVIILLARESSLENSATSELITLIESNTNTILYLLFLEDTTDDIIPSSLMNVTQAHGGRIFRVKNEAVFMLAELNVALLDASKNVLHLEDKILMIQKNTYVNVKTGISDVFLTPKNAKGKLLYSMQCKTRGDMTSINDACTDPDDKLPSPICGHEAILSGDENSAKVWNYTFRYGGDNEGTTCSSLALLKLEPPSKSSFTVRGWLSTNQVTPGQNALIIYAEVFNTMNQKFEVEARISGPGLKEFPLQLRDNGNGDPDIIQGDNIYSRYFVSFTQKGTYTVSIHAKAFLGYTNKKYTKENSQEKAKSLSQTKVIGAFRVTQSHPKVDIFPPNKIFDLRVASIDNANRNISLKWTAPGDDYDDGKALEYKIYITNDWRNLQETLMDKIPHDFLNTDKIIPKINGNEEWQDFQLPNISFSTIYYAAIETVDKSGNKGKISNIVQVPILFGESPYGNDTNGNNTESSKETNNESNAVTWYIIIGCISILIFIIIVNVFIWILCFRKHKRIHKRTRVKDKFECKSGNNINSDENILRSEFQNTYKHEERQSEEVIQTQNTESGNSSINDPLTTYAKIEKRSKVPKAASFTSHNNSNRCYQLPNHKEKDLGYV